MPAFNKGDQVQWNYRRAAVTGTVQDVYTSPVTREDVKNYPNKRNASEKNPAYLIEKEDGTHFLKSESELYDLSEE